MWKKYLRTAALCLMVVGCAGWNKSCATAGNGMIGSDWIIVQFDSTGRVFNCWTVRGGAVEAGDAGDGIDWQDRQTGHLVHIGGWYNRVQVSGGDFVGAGRHLGVDASECDSGRYPVHPQ